MSFTVNGRRFAQVESISCTCESALGFVRLFFDLALAVRERRCEGLPTLTELLGDLFVCVDGQRHYLGRLQATNAPIEISVADRSSSVRLDLELDHARLEALEDVRCGVGLDFELSLRGRVQVGEACHRVSDVQAHHVSREEWRGLVESR